jgi:hypothetical protein
MLGVRAAGKENVMEHMVPSLICLGIGFYFLSGKFTPGLGRPAFGRDALFAAVM